jgi:hypothetical protein
VTLALDGDEWSASCSGCFTPGERAPVTHWLGGWVGPTAGLDAVELRKISCLCRESNPGRPARSPSLYRLSYPGSQGPHNLHTQSDNTHRPKGKAIPVTGHEGPWGCETSRLPHFLDTRLTDGGKVVSPTRRTPFTPRKTSGTHFCWRLSRPQGHSAAGRIRSFEKSNDLMGIRSRDLPACGVVPQSTTLPRA